MEMEWGMTANPVFCEWLLFVFLRQDVTLWPTLASSWPPAVCTMLCHSRNS